MATRYYAIKRPDGSWIMATPSGSETLAWLNADEVERVASVKSPMWIAKAKAKGYRCCEVSGFVEVDK